MTLTDEMIQQFADAKNKSANEDLGGDDGSSEESAGAADAGGNEAEDAGSGDDSGEQSTGGDPSVGEDSAPSGDSAEPDSSDEGSEADTGGAPEDPVAAAEYWREQAERAEKRRLDTQAHKDKQLAEHQAKIEALEQLWDTEDAEYEAQQAKAAAASQIPGDTEQMDAWVSVAPQDAFVSVLSKAPERMGELIASVTRVHGSEMGMMAQQAYRDALMTQQLEAHKQEFSQWREQTEAPAKQRAEFAQAVSSVKEKYGDAELQTVAPRVRELISQNYQAEKDQYASVAAFVEAQYLRAYREQTLSAAVQQQSTPQAQKVAAPHVETGSGAAVAEPEKTYDQIKAEKLAQAFASGRTYA